MKFQKIEILHKNLYENKECSSENIDLRDLMKDTEMTTLTTEDADKLEGINLQ